MKFIRFIPFLLLLNDSCIEQFEIKDSAFVRSIVVDGIITDKPGPYTINLTYSSTVNSDLDKSDVVTGALITLHDNEGNSEQYTEVAPGTYRTSEGGMQGVVGKSYYITIRHNEKEYVSRPSRMLPSGTITDINGTFEENVLNFSNPVLPQDGIRVVFSSKGEPGAPNLFRWRWSGTYQVETFPSLRMKPGPRKILYADPFPCSGFIGNGPNLIFVRPCECCTCFQTEYGKAIMITENSFFNADEFNNVQLTIIPYETTRLWFKYRMKLEQVSLDEEAYEYWRKVKAQEDGRADIFQPNTIRIEGNLTCTSNPDERILGFFSAGAIAEISYEIPRTLMKKLLKQDETINDCRLQYPGSTTTRPPLW